MQASAVRMFREPPRFLCRCGAIRVIMHRSETAFDKTLKIAWLIMFHVGQF